MSFQKSSAKNDLEMTRHFCFFTYIISILFATLYCSVEMIVAVVDQELSEK